MAYVQQQLGFDDWSTVAAGDSPNDLLMLAQVRPVVLCALQGRGKGKREGLLKEVMLSAASLHIFCPQ